MALAWHWPSMAWHWPGMGTPAGKAWHGTSPAWPWHGTGPAWHGTGSAWALLQARQGKARHGTGPAWHDTGPAWHWHWQRSATAMPTAQRTLFGSRCDSASQSPHPQTLYGRAWDCCALRHRRPTVPLPPSACAQELKALIEARGLRSDDCIERTELIARAKVIAQRAACDAPRAMYRGTMGQCAAVATEAYRACSRPSTMRASHHVVAGRGGLGLEAHA